MIGERLAHLRQFMHEKGADGAVVMQPENLRYFSGFTGGEVALAVTQEHAVLWIHGIRSKLPASPGPGMMYRTTRDPCRSASHRH